MLFLALFLTLLCSQANMDPISITALIHCPLPHPRWCGQIYIIEEDSKLGKNDILKFDRFCVTGDEGKLHYVFNPNGDFPTFHYEFNCFLSHDCSTDNKWYCQTRAKPFQTLINGLQNVTFRIEVYQHGKLGQCPPPAKRH
ncbi:TransThyretin-Related family domain [Caenorhabditis elegans]|uniref:TransThyretin-Related family domain n=1 Tax=Caenorhabditis elegans TaxID=6239 RepID=Q20533_CAEEL|nr:TransThyretin-Related family domain [Caenorhabditis elegans]CCD71382.2 TransThyretin-Related family domain [Caenorhabditis elegans]|eukprot:NP_500456.2 Uncharacterized protein CELE_F47C12.7 [Caenorhabditis elegans]